jgi:micrococcal nuclease
MKIRTVMAAKGIAGGASSGMSGWMRRRFIGVDTPETVAPGQPIECYGPEASHFTTARLTGKVVELEFDRDLIDPYDRTLAYVWLDGRLFNETLVRRGFAEAKAYPPNTAHQTRFDAAEASTRASGRGLWGACGHA